MPAFSQAEVDYAEELGAAEPPGSLGSKLNNLGLELLQVSAWHRCASTAHGNVLCATCNYKL